MLKPEEILQHLRKQRINIVHDVIIRSEDKTIILYVPTNKISEKSEYGHASKIQLENLKNKISTHYSMKTEIIAIHPDEPNKITIAIETLLKSKFENVIESIDFVFLNAKKANIWIQSNNQSERLTKEITNNLESICKEFNINTTNVNWNHYQENLPSLVELLILTKTIQPANIDKYLVYLNDEFTTIAKPWLNKQLDKLIKKELVVRDKLYKNYSITGKGLGVIPNNISRSSSDIKRALDLGRRKW